MSPHGGFREGSGRRKLAEKTLMKSVKLTPDQWAKARKIGKGNAAEGIRMAIDAMEVKK